MSERVLDDDIGIEIQKQTTGNTSQIIEPIRRHSSSLVVAADELKFKAQQASDKTKKAVEDGKISKKDAENELKKAYKTLAHTYDKKALPTEYETNLESGLTTDEYNIRFEKYGLNQLTPPKVTPWYIRLFFSIFGGFFNVLLWFGAILCFVAYIADPSDIKDTANLSLGVVLAVVVTLTGIFSYFQESKSADLMGSLQAMNKSSDIEVIRDGKSMVIDPLNLVPGDIIIITSGQAVPADIRIFECSPDLEVNNSSLTGESEPCKRDWKPERADIVPAEAANLMFFGTSVINGKGKAVVFATGDNTFMGRTAALATSTDNESTPIAREIKDFVIKVSAIAFALGGTFFIWGVADRTSTLVENIIFLIGVIVANVPEGLLATVTVSLTLTASKMFEKNVRVKNLESVETLGSTSVICSDKTGTLTTSIMTCQHVYYNLKECLCETSQPMSALAGDFYNENKNRISDFLKLIRCGALCNNADFVNEPSKPEIHGTVQPNANPTEAAMVKFSSGHIAAEYKITVPQYRNEHKKLHEIPFNSKNKWQVSIHELTDKYFIENECKSDNKHAIIQMKGAPERILALCEKYSDNGESKLLTDDIRKQIMDGVLSLGGRGERVLALAELILDDKEYNINIPEPKLNELNITDIETGVSDNTIIIQYDEEKISIDLSNETDTDGNKIAFDDIFILSIKEKLVDKINLKVDAMRLYYGETKESLLNECTLSECGIKTGSIIKAYQGPYIFKGTSKDDINFPFRRNGEIGLVFVGLYAMIDPPRPGVPEAVAKCQSAGIKVIMVTGDHPVTAKAIAEQVNIIGVNAVTLDDIAESKYNGNKDLVKEDEYNAIVVPGWELQEILESNSDRQTIENFWNKTLTKDNIVFARTSPQQKLLIVSAVQDRGGIVAVTGDGVNDSPALKKADIGVAMGITGTDVAKESADMILLDDNFASIVSGIEEGRIIFDNLKKSIAYTLSSNIPEIAPFLFFQTTRIPLPLTVTMILLVDLGTDLAPAISMAYEGRESNIMSRPPRDPEIHKLVTWKLVSFAYLQIGMLQAIAGFYAYFVVLASFGLDSRYLWGLDKYGSFAFQPSSDILRDSYWLWCWDNDKDTRSHELWGNTHCIYTPEFEFEFQSESYFNDDLFAEWLENKNGFVVEAKDHIYKTCQTDTTCASLLPNRDLLNDKVYTDSTNSYVLVWDDTTTAGSTIVTTKCGTLSNCNGVSFKTIWTTYVEPIYREHTGTDNNYENRPCQLDEDHSNEYSDFTSKTPVLCNKYDHELKPKTYSTFPTNGNTPDGGKINANNITRTNAYSLFPMQIEQRTVALAQSNSAYFISIIIVQWADLMICKTRENSLFEQGMRNVFMNYALLFETVLGAFLVYVPASNTITKTQPIKFLWWTPAVPFSLMIYIYDELRKGIIRKMPGSWLHRNTFW